LLTSKSKLVHAAKTMVKNELRLTAYTVSVGEEKHVVEYTANLGLFPVYGRCEVSRRKTGALVMLFVNLGTLTKYGNQLAKSVLKENRDYVDMKAQEIAKAANRFVKTLKTKKEKLIELDKQKHL